MIIETQKKKGINRSGSGNSDCCFLSYQQKAVILKDPQSRDAAG